MSDDPKDEKTEAAPLPFVQSVDSPTIVSLCGHIQLHTSAMGFSSFVFVPPPTPNFQDPPDDHPIYNWIGRIAAKWARFEHDLDKLIWSLTAMPEGIGACVTGPLLGYTNKFLVLVALLKHLNVVENLIRRTMNLFQDAETRVEERNRCIHDAWFHDTGSKTLHQHKSVTRKDVRKKSNEKLTFGLQSKTEADLAETIKAIGELIERLSILHKEISAAQHASPGKP
jgi:hypothetical protein